MKPSKRNLENAAKEKAKLLEGRPLISKYDRKNMDDEQYQTLVAKQRNISRGLVKG